MIRPIRIDDYPYGTPSYDIASCRETLGRVFDIFELYHVPYIIGVIPLLIDQTDINLLNSKLRVGSAVMHGFDHLFPKWGDYRPITLSWPLGGEFAGMTFEQIGGAFVRAQDMMIKIDRWDRTQFVAPFNTYTQDLLDYLLVAGVKKIHTCDKEYDAYGYTKLDHHGIEPVISRWQQEYDFAFRLLDRSLSGKQITLHWMYDVRHDKNWVANYQRLCAKLIKE